MAAATKHSRRQIAGVNAGVQLFSEFSVIMIFKESLINGFGCADIAA
jgi:hypothetical protein